MGDPVESELSAHLTELTRPGRTEILRAKRAVMGMLDDGRAHQAAALVITGAQALEGPYDLERLEVVFPEAPDTNLLRSDDTVIMFIRRRVSAQWAVAELAAQALILPALNPMEGATYDRVGEQGPLRVSVRHPGGRFHVDVDILRPALEEAYVRSPLAQSEPKWYLDPDIFVDGMQSLGLDQRAVRALRESLTAFRQGMYLAAASLLGAVSEAAWYAAAERIGKPGGIAGAVANRATPKVQKLVANVFRQREAGSRTTPDELLAQAALLRDLRNYGIHPVEARDDLERYLAEDECGLLILRTHHYLTRLATTVEKAVAKGG